MKFSPLSQVQRVVIWASLSLALLAVLYPCPVLYVWVDDTSGILRAFGGSRGHWEKTHITRYEMKRYGHDTSRSRLWDFGFYGSVRPDYLRMATEAALVLLIGGGLVVALKGGRAIK
jgi:hypothetical protein